MIRNLFDQGVESGEFDIDNSEETAALFLDLLRGLRSAVFANKELIIIDDEEFQEMVKKADSLTRIFVNGIKRTETK